VTTTSDLRPSRAAAWLVLLGAVVVGAVLQGASAVPGLGTAASGWFAVQVVGSLVVLVAEVAVLAWAARAIALRSSLGRLTATLVAWSALVVVVTAAVAVVLPFAVPLVLVVALCLLVEAAAGERKALRGLRVFRRTPVRSVLVALVVVVVAVLSWVVALVAGFFLIGALGGAVTWLWFGVVAGLLLVRWTRLAVHAREREAPAAPTP
jgi:hypothetical protein